MQLLVAGLHVGLVAHPLGQQRQGQTVAVSMAMWSSHRKLSFSIIAIMASPPFLPPLPHVLHRHRVLLHPQPGGCLDLFRIYVKMEMLCT